MIYKEENIYIDYEACGLEMPAKAPVLRSYIINTTDHQYLYNERPAVIICPGGGYCCVADYVEGEPIALKFASAGFHSFVLDYSTNPVGFPGALLELSKAVAMVRENAEKYKINPNKIIVCGFSAGGHLAASLGVYWKESFITDRLGFHNEENKPNGLILGYPVISAKEDITHMGSVENLMSQHPSDSDVELFSLENNVSGVVPPTFLWHTSNDEAVNVQNSLVFASALRKHNIIFEMHIYPKGNHGLGLANSVTASSIEQIVPECDNWADMAIRFINNL